MGLTFAILASTYEGDTAKHLIDGDCLSTDTKPLNVMNGSTLKEMDTATLYKFDEDGKTWRAWKK